MDGSKSSCVSGKGWIRCRGKDRGGVVMEISHLCKLCKGEGLSKMKGKGRMVL